MSNMLAERAVLMRLSAGCVGRNRKDKRVTAEVKASKNLGQDAGDWSKHKYSKEALDPIKKVLSKAGTYHRKVTFPFGASGEDEEADATQEAQNGSDPIKGIGILPAVMIKEYGDTMRQFQGELAAVVEKHFLGNPQQWIDWARQEHNGTFDPKDYPGCEEQSDGTITFDAEEFRRVMRKKFYLKAEPLPVPDAEQFTASISQLLGTDVESVNLRVSDATQEAQRELMRRLIKPVKHMAERLKEAPKEGRSDIRFAHTLIDNIREIVSLGDKLNIGEDPEIKRFIQEMEPLTRYDVDVLREDKATRTEAAKAAEEMLKRLTGYKL